MANMTKTMNQGMSTLNLTYTNIIDDARLNVYE